MGLRPEGEGADGQMDIRAEEKSLLTSRCSSIDIVTRLTKAFVVNKPLQISA